MGIETHRPLRAWEGESLKRARVAIGGVGVGAQAGGF